MKPIQSNESRCVGICIDMDIKPEQSLGVFNTKMLLDWATLLHEQYGDDLVQVFTHESKAVKAKALVASSDGEEPFVVVTSYTEV